MPVKVLSLVTTRLAGLAVGYLLPGQKEAGFLSGLARIAENSAGPDREAFNEGDSVCG